jgi:polysaccharide deacetylase family protein (PEP-CTERM system associated)
LSKGYVKPRPDLPNLYRMNPGSTEERSEKGLKNVLTFEVEDGFHVDSPDVEPDDVKSRIIPILIHLLDLLDEQKATATFFVLGWVAQKFPEIVALLDARGHEVASHGWSHGDIVTMDKRRLVMELERSKAALEEIVQKPVNGYKGVTEQLRRADPELYRQIAKAGYLYDCTPFAHGVGAGHEEPLEIGFREGGKISVISQSAVKRWGVSLRFGERLRVFPLWFLRKAIAGLNRKGRFAMIGLKTWELDRHQSRPSGAGYSNYSRYGNLSLAEEKLLRLLDVFEFTTCSDVLDLEDQSEPNHNTGFESISL